MAHTRSTLQPEWSLLSAACSEVASAQHLAAQLKAAIRWKSLFALADHHGVLPTLYQRLSAVVELVPEDELATLKGSYEINLRKAMLLSLELVRIHHRLSKRGIEVLVYKGLALAESIYGDIAMRQAGDIDLLIHPSDFPRIRDAVRELGYNAHQQVPEPQERAYLKSGYECVFDGPAGPNLLELQWAIQPRFYAVDFDMDEIFRRAVTVSIAGHPMKTLSAEDLFLVLSAHAAKHVWGRLKWLCDLALIMNVPNLDWSAMATQAKELRIVRILRVGMLLANRILAAPIPFAADAALPQDAGAEKLVAGIWSRVLSDTASDVESFDYFRLMLRLRERNFDRLRFLGRLISTPGPGEWQAVRLPAELSPLYRLVRLSRLTARILRT